MSDDVTNAIIEEHTAPISNDSGSEEVQEVEEVEQVEESAEVEETEQVEQTEDPEPDLVADALKQNEALKAELEALKSAETNVFEENAILQKEVEKAKEAAKLAEENARIKAELDEIKRTALTKSMLASGQLNNDMEDWANGLTYEQLQQYAKTAPKRKTILDQKNNGVQESDTMADFRKKQSHSRIL